MFAEKLEIRAVFKIKDKMVAVLYDRMIVVVQVGNTGALAIMQELKFG